MKYTACLTVRYQYLGRYLALENFNCLSNKSIELTPINTVISTLVSGMKFSSVIRSNPYIGFNQDFLGHLSLDFKQDIWK